MKAAMAELDGWVLAEMQDRFGNQFYRRIDDPTEAGKEWRRAGEFPTSYQPLPDYMGSRDAVMPIVIRKCAVLTVRVKFLNNLRDEVAPEAPTNKVGTPLVTDYMLIVATPKQICTALLKALGKWKD